MKEVKVSEAQGQTFPVTSEVYTPTSALDLTKPSMLHHKTEMGLQQPRKEGEAR